MMPRSSPSVVAAFLALVWFSFRRQFKVSQVRWVGLGLLAIVSGVIVLVTYGPVGWRLENRTRQVSNLNDKDGSNPLRLTYAEYASQRLPMYEAYPGPPDAFGIKTAVFSAFRSMIADQQFREDFALLNFVRWVVFTLYLAFLLPLLTLSYGTAAIGQERESRTLLWLATRPIPRWGIYIATLLGALPWCLLAGLVGFAAVCLAGGELGWRALQSYWPAVLLGSVSFCCLFAFIGALFRRPTVVALVYIFFFETLVANLPGSLKQWSLSYYLRSLFYNQTSRTIDTIQPESVDVYAPTDDRTAWVTLLVVSVLLSALGAWLFHRQEPKEEV
jgi:ABC-2 type transport system permease protein